MDVILGQRFIRNTFDVKQNLFICCEVVDCHPCQDLTYPNWLKKDVQDLTLSLSDDKLFAIDQLPFLETEISELIFRNRRTQFPVFMTIILDGKRLDYVLSGCCHHDKIMDQWWMLNIQQHLESSNILHLSIWMTQEYKVKSKIFYDC